jgi:hypothetical protein
MCRFSDGAQHWGVKSLSVGRLGAKWGGMLLLAVSAWAADGPEKSAEGLFFEEMPVVEAASLHTQTLEDAPTAHWERRFRTSEVSTRSLTAPTTIWALGD